MASRKRQRRSLCAADGEETLAVGEGGKALPSSKAVKPGRSLEAARRHHGGHVARKGTYRAIRPGLTQGEASVELQVGSEEAGQAGQNLATGLPSVDLIAAVDQAVGGAAIVRFVQHPTEQLPVPDDHLQRGRPPLLDCR